MRKLMRIFLGLGGDVARRTCAQGSLDAGGWQRSTGDGNPPVPIRMGPWARAGIQIETRGRARWRASYSSSHAHSHDRPATIHRVAALDPMTSVRRSRRAGPRGLRLTIGANPMTRARER